MNDTPSLPTSPFLLREPPAANPPVSGPPGAEPMDLVFIEGFEGETVIGINTDELTLPQPVRIDLVAGLPRSRACETDRITDTIDYSAVHGALTRLLASHKMQLLEALAEAIANLLIDTFGAHWVRVVLVKPRKFDNVAAVGVAIERRRHSEREGPAPGPEDAAVAYLWRTAPRG